MIALMISHKLRVMSLTLYLFISKIRFKSNESNQIFVVLSWVNHEDWIIFKLAAHSCVNEWKGGKYVQTINQIFFDKIHTRLIYFLSFDVKREKIFPFSLQWLEVTTIELLPVVAAWYGNTCTACLFLPYYSYSMYGARDCTDSEWLLII